MQNEAALVGGIVVDLGVSTVMNNVISFFLESLEDFHMRSIISLEYFDIHPFELGESIDDGDCLGLGGRKLRIVDFVPRHRVGDGDDQDREGLERLSPEVG